MARGQRPAAPTRGLARLLCGVVVWALLSTQVLAAKSADAVSQPPSASVASRALDDKAAEAPKAAEPETVQQEGEAAQDAADEAAAKEAETEKSNKAAEEQKGILAELTHVKAELGRAKREIAGTSGAKHFLLLAEQDRAKQADENKRLTENVASQEKAVAELSSKITQSNKLLAETKTELEAIQQGQIKERTEHEAQKQKLTDEVAAKDAKIVELQSTLKLQTNAGEKTQAELVSTQATLTSTQKELAAANTKIEVSLAAAKAQHEEQTARYKELQNSAANEKAQAEALGKEHERLHGHHQTLEEMYADPSVQHFLNAKAHKVYKSPGIEGAANKTFVYVLPTLEKRYASGREFLNASQLAVYTKLNAFVGYDKVDPWLPAISGSLVYGGVIFPFICAVCCLTRIVCKLKPLLLFCHLDFLLTTLCAGIFALYTGKEPLAVFAHHDASVYLFTQVLFAVAFCLYLALLFCAYCLANSKLEGCYRIMQIAGALPILSIYFVYVWTPAMQDQMPKMDELVAWVVGDGAAVSNYAWVPYLPPAFLFAVLLRLERLSWHASGSASTKAKENQISVVMRSDVEMATIYGEESLPAVPKGD